MRKDERHAHIRQRAFELANTGEYSDYMEIETHLRFSESFPEALSVLDDGTTRMLLDRACKAAKSYGR